MMVFKGLAARGRRRDQHGKDHLGHVEGVENDIADFKTLSKQRFQGKEEKRQANDTIPCVL